MGLLGNRADRQNLKSARENLEAVSEREYRDNGNKPVPDDNPAYVEANRKVINVEKKLPWLGRW